MKKLDVESSDTYLEAENTIKYLRVLKQYYTSDNNFDQLELGEFKLREIFRFMSDHGFSKKGFVSEEDRQQYISNIDEEISKINKDLKDARLNEIQSKELNSLIIIPSWSKVLDYQTKGFYLNRPVLELRKDTIVMLSYDIIEKKDKFGKDLFLLTGPGIFYTEFSLDRGTYTTDFREINMILLPMEMLERVMAAPPIFESKIDATINELISLIPFSLIEEVDSVQALLKGIVSRNIFLPNKNAIDTFIREIGSPKSFHPTDGIKMLSAHEEYFNRLLLSNPPPQARGDSSINITSAGIASILVDRSLEDEFFEEKEKNRLLLLFRDLKKEFNETGKRLIDDFMP
ncbi:MAG: hypothetical protein ACW99A_03700 [Candidatus Kariarchaeaceae archaeon]